MSYKIKNSIFCSLLIICFSGCYSLKHSVRGIEGEYYSRNDRHVKLVLKENRFTYIDARKTGDLATLCCDTLAIGYFKIDKSRKFIVFNSPSWLNSMFININVVERSDFSKDTIYFSIQNPIEASYRKFNSTGNALNYTLIVQPKGGTVSDFKEISQPFEDNIIKFYNPKHLDIANFNISIVPASMTYVKHLETKELFSPEYTVKNKEANFFQINIPQLTYEFISLKRLQDDYVKIENEHTILWDGVEYIR